MRVSSLARFPVRGGSRFEPRALAPGLSSWRSSWPGAPVSCGSGVAFPSAGSWECLAVSRVDAPGSLEGKGAPRSRCF